MKTSAELKVELEELKRQSKALAVEADELEKRLATVRELRSDLDGRGRRSGYIEYTMTKIIEVESRERDESCPSPVWIETPTERYTNLVVSRITKKRIVIKEIGGSEIPFSVETGTSVYDRYGYEQARLDVNATIDNWNADAKSRE